MKGKSSFFFSYNNNNSNNITILTRLYWLSFLIPIISKIKEQENKKIGIYILKQFFF